MFDCQASDCSREFRAWTSACQHMNALGHWECETCYDQFYSEEDVDDHMDEEGHWGPKFECEACDARFYTHNSARKHMDASNHWRIYWCDECSRGFQNENNLNMVSSTAINPKSQHGQDRTSPSHQLILTSHTASQQQNPPWKQHHVSLLQARIHHCNRRRPSSRVRLLSQCLQRFPRHHPP